MKRKRRLIKKQNRRYKSFFRRNSPILTVGGVVLFSSLLFSFTLLRTQIVSNSLFRIEEVRVNDPAFNFSYLKGRNIFTLSLKEVANTVEHDPRISAIFINKIFPSTLQISLKRRLPFASVITSEKPLIVAKDGTVLPEESGLAEPLLEIYGVPYTELSHLIPKAAYAYEYCSSWAPIKTIVFSGSTLTLNLESGEAIIFFADEIAEKLPLFYYVLADFKKKGLIYKYLDFRFCTPVFLPAKKEAKD